MMNTIHSFFILGAIAAFLAGCKSSTETQLNGGSGNGTNGPGFLYAGTFGDGVFRSTDNGLSWLRTDSGLTSDSILALASNGTYLFAGTYGRGIFRSSDNGQSWMQVNSGLSNLFIQSLLTSGSNLYVGTDKGIFSSTDSGENWSPTEYTDIDIRALTAMGRVLFAASTITIHGQLGVFRSSDSGLSWSLMDNGFPDITTNVLAAVGQTLLAGTIEGLFISNDSGVSWQSTNVQGSAWALFGNGNNLLAGLINGEIFHSIDDGNNWVSSTISTSSDVRGFASDGVRIFAGTDGNGVFVSTDNGAEWVTANNGIENEQVTAVAIH
jgi:hypothetical protein